MGIEGRTAQSAGASIEKREMHIRSQQLGPRGVSMDMKTSWAAQEYDSTLATLETMREMMRLKSNYPPAQARFQQKQLQEKEQKLLQLYDQQQQRAYQVAQRASAGSNSSNTGSTVKTTTTTAHSTSTSQGGKVRQMFDERRQTTVKGIDRSYPLEPLENKPRKQTNANGVAQHRNGNLTVNRQSVCVKRVARADVNSNVNAGKPSLLSYHEELTRGESFGPPPVYRHDHENEFGAENRVGTFANGYYRQDAENEEGGLDEDTIERNRTMAKIHLMGYDESLKHRARNDLESEEFPEYLMPDVSDKLSKRNPVKKLSQAEVRLERFKNANARRSNASKQSTNNAMKKRSEQTIPATSNPSFVRRYVLRGNEAKEGATASDARSEQPRTRESSRRISMDAMDRPPSGTRSLHRLSPVDVASGRPRERSDAKGSSAQAIATTVTYPARSYSEVAGSPSPRFFHASPERPGTATSAYDRYSTASDSSVRRTLRRRGSAGFDGKGEEPRSLSIDRKSDGSSWSGDGSCGERGVTRPRRADRWCELDATPCKDVGVEYGARWRESPEFLYRDFSERSGSGNVSGSGWPERRANVFAKLNESPRYFRGEKSVRAKSDPLRSLFGGETGSFAGTRSISSQPGWFLRTYESARSPTRRVGRSASPPYLSRECTKPTGNRRMSADGKARSPPRGETDKKSRTSVQLDRGVSSLRGTPPREPEARRRTSPSRYSGGESEGSGTTASVDRKTDASRSLRNERPIATARSGSPQFFCKESEKSATTMSIDREVADTLSLDRETSGRRGTISGRKIGQSEKSASVDGTADPSKWSASADDERIARPQFFCRESERSATTVLIEPTKPTKSVRRQRGDVADVTYFKRSPKSSAFVRAKVRPTRNSPPVTKREMRRDARTNAPSVATATSRGSSKISETPATSASSIVSLKYGLEFDNIFQSAGLVRKFMKAQSADKRDARRSAARRIIAYSTARTSKNGQANKGSRITDTSDESRSTSVERARKGTKRITPELFRGSITPSEIDMEIQEITMTDHHIERDNLPRASTPLPKSRGGKVRGRSFDDTSRLKIATGVRGANRSPASTLEFDVVETTGRRLRDPGDNRGRNVVGPIEPAVATGPKKNEDRACGLRVGRQGAHGRSAKHQAEWTSVRFGGREGSLSRTPRPAEVRTRARSLETISADLAAGQKYRGDTVTRGRRVETRVKTDRTENSRFRGLAGDKANEGNLSGSARRECNGGGANAGVDEVDSRYRSITEKALAARNGRGIARANSAGCHALGDVRRTKRAATTTTTTTTRWSFRTIAPAKKCGKQQRDMQRRGSTGRSCVATAGVKVISRGAVDPQIPRGAVARTGGKSAAGGLSTRAARKREGTAADALNAATAKESRGVSGRTGVKDKGSPEVPRVDKPAAGDHGGVDCAESTAVRRHGVDLRREYSDAPGRACTQISLRTMDADARTSAGKRSTAGAVGKWNLRNSSDEGAAEVLGVRTRSYGGITKWRSATGKKRGVAQARPPACKRRLFECNSEAEEMGELWKARRKGDRKYREDRAAMKEEGCRRDTRPAAAKVSHESADALVSVKPLRSIEDIRRSIGNGRDDGITRTKGSAIAKRHWRGNIGATGAARVTRGTDPVGLTKMTSCVSRIAKSPSPDFAARKQHETNARATRGGSIPSSPSKSPDIVPKRASTEQKNPEARPWRRATLTKGAESMASETTETVDGVDGVVLQNGSSRGSSKKSDAFVIELADRSSKEIHSASKKAPIRKRPNDKHQASSSAPGRPTSSVSSNSSVGSIQDQTSPAKGKMAARSKTPTAGSAQTRGPLSSKSAGNVNSANNLATCNTCGRRFAHDRVDLHEQICAKTMNKKRKQFDAMMFRVKGTELEPFVKKGIAKKQEPRSKKPEVTSNWRRKHEDFINAIRSAKQVQAHLAAGGKLSDLPPPPASDTSDYIQCPHCGRKFNQAAAERHIPKCEHMLHNKPLHARAPRPRR